MSAYIDNHSKGKSGTFLAGFSGGFPFFRGGGVKDLLGGGGGGGARGPRGRGLSVNKVRIF